MLVHMCACMQVHMCVGPGRVHVRAYVEGPRGRKKTGKMEGGTAGGLGHSDYEMSCTVTDFKGKEQLGLPQCWNGDPVGGRFV